jgi:heme/copper-type cytochrome/quinol oxidase subunit 4
MKFFYLGILGIVTTVFVAVFILERGKIKTKTAITGILVGSVIGFSFHITYFYHRTNLEFPFDPRFFLLFPLVLFVWVLGLEWYQAIKKRDSFLNVLFMTIAVLIYLVIPFLSLRLGNWMFLASLPFLISYFVLDFRARKIPQGWLESYIEETISEVKEKGKYTNKPILIKEQLDTRFVSQHFGIFILFKKDRVLCRMSKKYHKKLGEPNLQEFFEILISKVKAYLEKKTPNKPFQKEAKK